MSLQEISDPIVRSYFKNKYGGEGGSGGGEGGNIAVDGGVFSFDGSIVHGYTDRLYLKISDEPIPFDRIREIYINTWLRRKEEGWPDVPQTPCSDGWINESDGYEELTVNVPGTDEYAGVMYRVTADEVKIQFGVIEYERDTLTKGLYWASSFCYPTRVVFAPAE